MKKTLFLLLMSVMFLSVSYAQNKTTSDSKSAAKDAISKSLDNLYAAYLAKDSKKMATFFTEDCLICGTAPEEFWDKTHYLKIMSETFADTSFHPQNTIIDKREIRFEKNGTSAIVIEQFFVPEWSSKIPVRNMSHVVKIGGVWKCDIFSSSFIPANKDLNKIFKSVM